jgi:hypothetical protein
MVREGKKTSEILGRNIHLLKGRHSISFSAFTSTPATMMKKSSRRYLSNEFGLAGDRARVSHQEHCTRILHRQEYEHNVPHWHPVDQKCLEARLK